MATIKEVAARCGVSAQAVSKYLRDYGLRDECTKVGNRLSIPATIESQLYAHYGVESGPKVAESCQRVGNQNNQNEVIEELRATIKSQRAAIDNQVAQIDNLTRLLDQQQRLTGDIQRQLDEARRPWLRRVFDRRKALGDGGASQTVE